MRLHRADGSECGWSIPTLLRALAEYRLGRPELLRVPTRDGFPMEAMLLRPPDFDPGKRYPVYPARLRRAALAGGQERLGRHRSLFHQLLAQQGVVVWICDNRTASGKGAVSAWPVYRNFGELSCATSRTALDWLRAARAGRTSTHRDQRLELRRVHRHATRSRTARRFAMGIAGGTVADWRNYDSIYTERYMDLPHAQRGRLPPQLAALRAARPARRAAADPRRDRRQRAPAEHDAARLRAAEGAASRSR